MILPRVSVIIPVYNVESYIECCARSLFDQTLDDIEYIFVNDATPDNSIKILLCVIELYPLRKSQIKIIHHQENKGLPTARNSGLDVATGEYIIHCDSDDWIEKDMYEKLYNKAIADNADIVICDIWREYIHKSVYCRQRFNKKRDDCFRLMLSGVIGGYTVNRLIKKDLYINNNIRFFEGLNMWEDLVTTIQLHYFAHKISYISKAFYHYIKYNTNSIVNRINKQQLEGMLKSCQVIESFLHQHHIYEQYYVSFMERVFKSKSNMILVVSLRDWKRWNILWPDSNNLIWHYHISLYDQVLFFFIKERYYFFATKMLNIRARLIKLKRRIEGRSG